jgi:hypothetical protein
MRKHLAFGNVISVIALFVALGGTGYAAVRLQANSVGAKQIRTKAVRASELAPNAVTSRKVRNRSLRAVDFASGQLPAGPRGPEGPPGRDAASPQVRSAFAAKDNDALVGTDGAAVTATIQAPTSGFLLVSASSDVWNTNAGDLLTCKLEVDDQGVPGTERQIQLTMTTNTEEDCATEGALAVAAGTHKVDLEGGGLEANSHFDEASLQVLFVPLGATGSQP